ncbi:MAG: hypothetical protein Q9206_004137, partial [Seirophora lacunosa]
HPLHNRLQTFLPAIRASNALLERQPPSERDIETVTDAAKPYIELDLGLGVLEEKQQQPEGQQQEIVKTKRERSVGREGDGVVREREGEEDILGSLLGRRWTPEARERKRRRVGIEVL